MENNFKCHFTECTGPGVQKLSLNALKPDVVKQVSDNCEHKFLKNMYAKYEYNEELNDKMKRFLSALDERRKTNSKQVLPWCWE